MRELKGKSDREDGSFGEKGNDRRSRRKGAKRRPRKQWSDAFPFSGKLDYTMTSIKQQ